MIHLGEDEGRSTSSTNRDPELLSHDDTPTVQHIRKAEAPHERASSLFAEAPTRVLPHE